MYILEGNIGAGKSTFLKLLAQNISAISVGFEPLHNWQSKVHGQSLLSNFYEKPQRWAYSLETFAMICRVYEHLKDQEYEHDIIIERSIYSGHYVFAVNGYEQGFMSDIEWHMYNQWFNALVSTHCKKPQGFIYLRVDPAIAYKRIKKRNRLAEKKITLAYLKQIHACHEKFLREKVGILSELTSVPVLILDCNEDFENDERVLQSHLDLVKDFVIKSNLIV